jgi:hypothetical protein
MDRSPKGTDMPILFKARLPAAVTTMLAAAVLAIPLGGAAHAQDAYRFWAYYTWPGNSWQFSQAGPDQSNPPDGTVEGWRFAVSGAESSARTPRAAGIVFVVAATALIVARRRSPDQ